MERKLFYKPKSIRILYRNRMPNKAIFLDRDWTLNYDYSYVYKLKDLKILDWVKEGLENLKSLWYLLILITNQSWIWRWYYSLKDCNTFNNELQKQLWINFDAIYICPHTKEDNCKCRKPNTLFMGKAIRKFNLDIKQCYMIWDKESDIQMWVNAWCKTVRIKNDIHRTKLKPDYTVKNIKEFSDLIQ